MPRCLIFDADDTLWENNIYFQQTIEEFLVMVSPFAPDPLRVRALLIEVEHECIPTGGYGTRNFIVALKQTCRRLYKGKGVEAVLRQIDEIGDKLIRHPMDLRPGVAETLEALH